MTPTLVDNHQRSIKKLRVSLLDACNMKCLYCMPDSVEFSNKENWLTVSQLKTICANLVSMGIEEIRLTGGEPTLRPNFIEIVEQLSTLKLKKLALTTNGIKLGNQLFALKETNLNYINISIDSLLKEKFKSITKYDGLDIILENIELAKKLGFNLKINTVLLKGVNDDEIENFIEFSRVYNIPVRFLEVMKIGPMVNQFDKYHIAADTIIKRIEKKYELKKVNDSLDSTSFNFDLNNGARIGFIASETKSFCNQCSRLRMGPDGTIYPCLFVDQGLSLKNAKKAEYEYILQNILSKKPTERISEINKPMHAIGG